MTLGSKPGEAARAGDKKGASVDRGPRGNPGDSPGFTEILPHGSVLNLSVASYSVKASCQLTNT